MFLLNAHLFVLVLTSLSGFVCDTWVKPKIALNLQYHCHTDARLLWPFSFGSMWEVLLDSWNLQDQAHLIFFAASCPETITAERDKQLLWYHLILEGSWEKFKFGCLLPVVGGTCRVMAIIIANALKLSSNTEQGCFCFTSH